MSTSTRADHLKSVKAELTALGWALAAMIATLNSATAWIGLYTAKANLSAALRAPATPTAAILIVVEDEHSLYRPQHRDPLLRSGRQGASTTTLQGHGPVPRSAGQAASTTLPTHGLPRSAGQGGSRTLQGHEPARSGRQGESMTLPGPTFIRPAVERERSAVLERELAPCPGVGRDISALLEREAPPRRAVGRENVAVLEREAAPCLAKVLR